MSRYLLIGIMGFIFLTSCEDEESNENPNPVFFKLTDQNYYENDFIIYIHHSENPQLDALAKVQVERGGQAVFKETTISGGPFVGINSLEIDLSSIENDFIVTVVEVATSSDSRGAIITNWGVEKGSKWTLIGTEQTTDYGDSTSEVMSSHVISPSLTSEIDAVFTETLGSALSLGSIENDCDFTSGEFNNMYGNPSLLNDHNYVIGLEMNNGSKILGTSSVEWNNCGQFQVENWYEDGFYDLDIPYNLSMDDPASVLSMRTSNFEKTSDGRIYYFMDSNYNSSSSISSSGIVSLNTTDQLSFAQNKYIRTYTTHYEPFYRRSGTIYYGTYSGEDVNIRELTFNFDLESEDGSISNITAEEDIDQLLFSYDMDLDGTPYYWHNYLDPKNLTQMNLPKLDLGLTNSLSWYYYPQAFAYSAYEGQNEVLEALREDHTFNTTNTTYSYSYYGIPWETGSRNNSTEYLESQDDQNSFDRLYK